MRKEVANQLRGLLKVFGHVIGAAGGEKFDARARELAAGDTTLTITAEALLAARVAKVARRDKLLLAQARQDRHRNGWLRQLAKAGLIDGVCWVVPRDSRRLQA